MMKVTSVRSLRSIQRRIMPCVLASVFAFLSFGTQAEQQKPNRGFPDLQTPSYVTTLFTDSTNFIGSDEAVFDFVVFIGEIKGVDGNGVQSLTFSLPAGGYYQVEYDPNLQYMNGRNLSNVDWEYSTDGSLHTFTYTGNNGVFPGGGHAFIGVNARFVRPDREVVTLEVNIAPDSGGQTDSPRNSDSDFIYY